MKTTDINFWQLYVDNAGHFHAFIASPATWRYVDLYHESGIATLWHELSNNKLSIADIDNYYTPSTEQEEITQTFEEMQADSCNYKGIAWSYEPFTPESIATEDSTVALIQRMFAAMNGVDEFLETFKETHYSVISDTLNEMPLRFVREHLSSESDCTAILRYIAAETRKFSTSPEEIAAELETAAQELNLIESVDVRYWKGEEESNPAECDYMEIAFEVPRSQANSEFRNRIADLIAGHEWKLADVEWRGQQSWHRFTK